MRPKPVLLNGNMCDSRMWAPSVRARIGPSVDADLTRDDSILAMAARVLESTTGVLAPIGFSMGGIVALAMCSIAPRRIGAIALLDTNPAADLPKRAAVRPRQQADVRAGNLESVIVNELKPHYLAAAHSSNQAILSLLRDMAMTLGEDVFIRQSEALRTRPDFRPVLQGLDVPVFIGCGAEDRLCPPVWHESMARVVTHATLRIVSGAGHMLPLERPDSLGSELGDWLESTVSRSSCTAS